MSKENKNKEKQRNSAGYESRTVMEKKERHACWGLCVACDAKGPTAAGVLILVGWSVLELILCLSVSARECAVSFTTSHSSLPRTRRGLTVERWDRRHKIINRETRLPRSRTVLQERGSHAGKYEKLGFVGDI